MYKLVSRSYVCALFMKFLEYLQCTHAFPQFQEAGQSRQPRQDEDDDSSATPVNIGAQVAQIITGAFTGNLDSIIKGSFGFIGNPTVNQLSHNTWETLKGKPTKVPIGEDPDATTTKEVEPETERVPVKKPQPRPSRPPVQAVTVSALRPVKIQSLAVKEPVRSPVIQSSPQGSVVIQSVYNPDLYYPGSPNNPTRSPVRTTQPTYATLAPLSVVERTTEPEPDPQTETETTEPQTEAEETSTIATTTEEYDDGDEAEGEFSSEFATAADQKNL